MNEADAIDWLRARYADAIVLKLERFVALLTAENALQNLISRNSIESIWARHIVDSAQLNLLAPQSGLWIDIGSGGGLPGLVIAIVRGGPVTLIEPRRRRAEFLDRAAEALELPLVKVRTENASDYDGPSPVTISARAVTTVEGILDACGKFTSPRTQFVLPRGRSARDDLDRARQSWHGVFHVKPSVTSDEGGIIVAEGVKPR